jgi:ankyrin repeat protein
MSAKERASSTTSRKVPQPLQTSPNQTKIKENELDCIDDDQMTPIMWAASLGHTGQVQSLIRAGANLHLCDIEGKTVLHWASFNKHVQVVKALVEASFDLILARDKYGRTPLHLACAEGNIGMVYFLIGVWSAVINEKDDIGRSPLHWAASKIFAK